MKLFDGRSEFYQYDTNQKLVCDECKVGEEIHFSNRFYSNALICLTYEFESSVVVNVPNSFLLNSGEFIAYRMYVDDVGRMTIDKHTFNVQPRKKPSDFIYTETEVKSIEKIITDSLTEAKESGEFDGRDGIDGYNPKKGLDYWTPDDVQEMKLYYIDQLGNHNTDVTAHPQMQEKLNTVENIAKGRNHAVVFDTFSAMTEWLKVASNVATLEIGTNLYIRELNVPDYWWDGTTYQELEVEHPDLTQYATKVELQANIPLVIEQSDYNALVENGTLQANRIYYVVMDGELG